MIATSCSLIRSTTIAHGSHRISQVLILNLEYPGTRSESSFSSLAYLSYIQGYRLIPHRWSLTHAASRSIKTQSSWPMRGSMLPKWSAQSCSSPQGFLSVSMITSMVIVIMLMQIMMSVLSYLCNRTTNSAMCIFIFTGFPTWFITATNICMDDIFGHNCMLSIRQAGCKSQASDELGQRPGPKLPIS